METLEKLQFTDKNPAFVDLVDLATFDKMKKDEKIAYDRSLKLMWDYKATMDFAHDNGWKEGFEEGFVKGKTEVLAEGIKEGITKGERNVAINMKKLGFDIDTIAQVTGLSKEEIETL